MDGYYEYELDQDELYENQLNLGHVENLYENRQNLHSNSDGLGEDLYENRQNLHNNSDDLGVDLHENQQQLHGNDDGLEVDYRESVALKDILVGGHHDRLTKEHTCNSDAETNRQLTNKHKRFIGESYDVNIKSPAKFKRCFWCLVGFVIGFVLTSAGFLAAHFLIIPYIKSILNESMSACPTSWILHGRHCYYFSSYNKSWGDAEQNCVKMNAYLADVLNKEDSTWLTASVVDINEDVWIGGKGKNGTNFEWNYGKSLNAKIDHFTNWAAGQPSYANGSDQNCIQLWKEQQFKWDNEYCYKERKFVCKQQI